MSRHFSTILCAVCALLLLVGAGGATGARAGDSLWWHNGSLMHYRAEDTERMFFYYRPREGLAHRKGRLLFYGLKRGETLNGVAFLFRKGCRPAFYPVRGYAETPTHIVLHGAVPDRGRTGCAIRRWRENGPGSRLVFTYSRRAPDGLRPPPVPESIARDIEVVIERPYRTRDFPVPGGELLVRSPDYVAPASFPFNIFVEARCTGRPPVMTRRFLACALRDARHDAASGTLVLTMLRYNPRTATCAGVPHRETIAVGAPCE